MFKLFALSFLMLSLNTIAQDLTVTAGGDDAFCRLYGYQNGNGQVYAIASGGVPDYTYEWTNLSTDATFTANTWGGLNIGCYEIKVTDMEGTIARDTICLDSINPIAEFFVVSAELDFMEWAYVGEAPVEVAFHTDGIPIASPPFFDTTFIFRPQGFEPWVAYEHYDGEFATYNYMYGGDYTATMIAINKNGCTDTAHARIYLSGPLSIDEPTKIECFSIVSHSNSGSISVTKQGYEEGLQLNLYTLSGQQVQTHIINDAYYEFNAPLTKGVYIYELIDSKTGQRIANGKFGY
jgi:hypothetical protein